MTLLDPSQLVLGGVIADPIRDLSAVLLAALVTIALIARTPAARWTSSILALVVAPLLLAGAVLEDDRVNRLLDHPALLGAAAVAGLIGLVVMVAVLMRWPNVLPVLIAVAMPLRLPIVIGGESVNLLLPLYGLIGAGAGAFAVRARQRGKRLAESWDLRQGPTTAEVLTEAWTARSLSGAAALVPVLLAASVALYALRVPFSEDPDRGVQTLCFFLVPFSVLFVVLREIKFDRPQLIRVGVALVVLAVIAVVLGDYEYVTGRPLWHQNVLDASSLNATIRVNSLFFDPNIYGRFLMLILLGLVTAMAWGARGARVLLLGALLLGLWIGLLFTYSQSSMLGLLIGALVLLGLRFGARRALGAAAALVAVGLIAIAFFSSQLHLDVTSEKGLNDAGSGRVDLIKGGVSLFEAKPVFGWGAGSYRRAYRSHEGGSKTKAVDASHTIPVTVAAEEGVIGLLVYFALVGAALVALLRGARRTLARAAIAAAFVALVLHSWLYAAFLEDPSTWALLAVGLGLGAMEAGADDPDAAEGSTDGSRSVDPPRPHTPHDITGPVTLVDVGEGSGPGLSVGDDGAPAVTPAGPAATLAGPSHGPAEQDAGGRWPTSRRGALLVVAGSLLAWLLLPTAPNYDTATHLVWAHELLGGRAPDTSAAAAPTLHPLWLLIAVPAQLTGVGASLLQLVTILSFGVVIACSYRLAADVAGRAGGALAALATASSFALILLAFKAYVDLPFLALVLTALVVERRGGSRPLTVPVLFLLAGLLRPEAWAFGLLFMAVRLVRGAERRTLVAPVLVIVAAPVLWAIADTILSGDPLHSLTGTRALAEELGRPTGLLNAPKELLLLLGDLARPPAAAAGVLGIALALRLGGWRPLALPLVVLGAGCLGFLAVGALGLPLLQRYLLVPAVLLCVFAGIAGAVIVETARGRGPHGSVSPAIRGLAAGLLVVGVLGVAGYLAMKADSFRIVGQGVLREARWQRQATQLIEDPRVVAQRCGPITLPTYRFIPELTLRAGLDAGQIVSRSTALGGAGPQSKGVALVIAGDRADKVRLGWAAGVPRSTNTTPPGFTEIARRGPFIATAHC